MAAEGFVEAVMMAGSVRREAQAQAQRASTLGEASKTDSSRRQQRASWGIGRGWVVSVKVDVEGRPPGRNGVQAKRGMMRCDDAGFTESRREKNEGISWTCACLTYLAGRSRSGRVSVAPLEGVASLGLEGTSKW